MKRILRTSAALLAAMTIALGSSGVHSAELKKVAISTIVEVPQLLETRDGVIKGLAEKGFADGKDIKVDYQTANGNLPTQQQISKKFVGDGVDVIVAITTPTAQAMASVTTTIPIVFATVTDPVKAKLIPQYKAPGGNITGVSDAAPIAEQLKLFREILPKLKKLVLSSIPAWTARMRHSSDCVMRPSHLVFPLWKPRRRPQTKSFRRPRS